MKLVFKQNVRNLVAFHQSIKDILGIVPVKADRNVFVKVNNGIYNFVESVCVRARSFNPRACKLMCNKYQRSNVLKELRRE